MRGPIHRWRIFQNVIVSIAVLSLIVAGTFTVVEAVLQRRALTACLEAQGKQRNARERRDQAQHESQRLAAAGKERRQEDAAYRKKEAEARNAAQDEVTRCAELGEDPGTAIARASYELSFLGSIVAWVFGAVGVLGVLLTFSVARDALDAASGGGASDLGDPGESGRGTRRSILASFDGPSFSVVAIVALLLLRRRGARQRRSGLAGRDDRGGAERK